MYYKYYLLYMHNTYISDKSPPTFCFFLKNFLAIFIILDFHINFSISLSISPSNCIGNLIEILSNLHIVTYDIGIIVNVLNHEYDRSLHFFSSSLISFCKDPQFSKQKTGRTMVIFGQNCSYIFNSFYSIAKSIFYLFLTVVPVIQNCN